MTVSPRALLFAAPALVVLAGSFWMSRLVVHQADRNETKSHFERESNSPPTEADEECVHRLAIKLEIINDLLDERIRLEEAVLRFESVMGLPENSADASLPMSTDTNFQRALAQVMSFARMNARFETERLNPALERIEAEAARLLSSTDGKNQLDTIR